MSKVAFLGGGSFGIALAILLANKGNVISAQYSTRRNSWYKWV